MPNYIERTVVCLAAGGEIVGPSRARIGIVFPGPPTNRYTLSTRAIPTIDVGLTLYPALAPLSIRIETYGDGVKQAWFAISAVADQTIVIGEIIE
jgi:hypothetical protein